MTTALKDKPVTTPTPRVTPPPAGTVPPTPIGMPYATILPGPVAGLLQRFTEDMERVFSDFGVGFGPGRTGYTPSLFQKGRILLNRGLEGVTTAIPWTPRIEVCTEGDRFICTAELPGLTRDDIKVEVSEGMLTVSGEKQNTVEKTTAGTYHSEYAYGSFYRQIPIPEGCDLDKAEVTLVNGVLKVAVPLPAGAKCRTRRLEIKEG